MCRLIHGEPAAMRAYVPQRQMVMSGVVPMTWMAVTGELQRDWARQDSALALGGILAEHGGGSGVAFA
jgi:hypothetical protein